MSIMRGRMQWFGHFECVKQCMLTETEGIRQVRQRRPGGIVTDGIQRVLA